MKTPELTIVAKQELRELLERSKLWWMGWAVAAVSLMTAVAILVAGAHIIHRADQALLLADDVNSRQLEVMAAQVKTWQNQQDGIRLVTTWAQYVKDRVDLSSENGPGLPYAPAKPRQAPLAGVTP